MEYRKFTKEELQEPKNRAQFIHQMPISMRVEVLEMFKEMARGHSGGAAGTKRGETIRKRHYPQFPDSWFDDVLCEYKILHTLNS